MCNVVDENIVNQLLYHEISENLPYHTKPGQWDSHTGQWEPQWDSHADQ